MQDIPLADRPLDYAAITDITITAAGNHGTADGYFDAYSLDTATSITPADEFVFRNSIVHNFDTSSFTVYPSVELGSFRQSQRFNFSINQPSDWVTFASGNAAILPTQQTGYPAQLNCPGSCTPAQDVLNTQGEGADFIETRLPAFQTLWDGVLQQGVQIIGTWSSDAHAGIAAGMVATYIYAPTTGFDDLLHSLYEGRTYDALNNFSGPVIFNLDPTSQEPYPVRYPVYVPDTQSTANVHLAIGSGLVAGRQNPLERERRGHLYRYRFRAELRRHQGDYANRHAHLRPSGSTQFCGRTKSDDAGNLLPRSTRPPRGHGPQC